MFQWQLSISSHGDLLRIMYELPRITNFGARMRRVANHFHEWRSHEWKSLVNRFTSDPRSVIHGNRYIISFLHAILFPKHTIPLKTIIHRWFRHCRWGRPFLTKHCDVTTVYLWRHANARYWYCDVIFVDCQCTRKLAQRWSSLVINRYVYI